MGTENKAIKWVTLRDWHRGIASTPSLPGECATFTNVRYSRDGTVAPRGGIAALTADLGNRAQGCYSTRAGGTEKWLFVVDGKVYDSAKSPVSPGSALYTGGDIDNYPSFDSFGGYALIFNIDAKPLKYDGSVITTISAAPPTTTILGKVHADRLFVMGTNRLYYSSQGDITTFPSDNWIDVGDSSEPIGALAVLRDSLIIFKHHSIWELSGKSDDDFYLRRLTTDLGVHDHTSVVPYGESFLFFVYMGRLWSLSSGFNYVSDQITEEIRSVSTSNKVLSMDRANQVLYIAVPTGASEGHVNSWDLIHKTWSRDTGDYCWFFCDDDGTFAGKRLDGLFVQLNSGTTDAGSGIACDLQHRYTDCGLEDYEKYLRTIIVEGSSDAAGVTVKVNFRMNPGGSVTTLTYASQTLPCVIDLPKNRFVEVSPEVTTAAGVNLKVKAFKLGIIPIRRKR